MTDYKAYREHVGIENPDMTRTLRGVYRKFTRPASTMINNPQTYGVCLLPEAEQHLVEIYGPGPGLAFIPFEEAKPEKKKRPDRRRKSCRITFRMDDETYGKALELKEAAGAFSMQELFEIILKDAIRRWEADEE